MSDKLDPSLSNWIKDQNELSRYLRNRIENLERDFELIKRHLGVAIVDIPAKRVVEPNQ